MNFNFPFAKKKQQVQLFDPEMTDSSSQSDDTSGGGGTTTTRTSRGRSATNSRRRKGQLNAKERNLRRLESNERERMRMHSLNDAYEVRTPGTWQLKLITQLIGLIIIIDDLTKLLTCLTVSLSFSSARSVYLYFCLCPI